ncbi:MAG: hypothetical protein EHM88_22075, partial [Candidatus Rokuibacteriota bacterium]
AADPRRGCRRSRRRPASSRHPLGRAARPGHRRRGPATVLRLRRRDPGRGGRRHRRRARRREDRRGPRRGLLQRGAAAAVRRCRRPWCHRGFRHLAPAPS